MAHPILLLVWVGTLVLTVATSAVVLVFFDRLLRIQFAECRSEWERQGCPAGFFWFPRESEPSSGTHARGVLVAEWARTVPDWISVSERASRAYALFRWSRIVALATRYIFIAEIVGFIILGAAEGTIGGSK